MKLIRSTSVTPRRAPRHERRSPGERLGSGLERSLRLLWRNFWLVTATAVLLCAIFAAQAAAHLVEASLAAVAPSPEAAPPRPAAPAEQPAVAPAPVSAVSAPSAVSVSWGPRPTLSLLATHVSADPRRSFASIVEVATRSHGGYQLGDRLPGGGVVASIHYQYVEVDYAGQLDRLALASDAAPPVTMEPVPSPLPGSLTPEERALEEGIRQVDDGRYEVDRALVEQVLANPMAFTRKLRAVPAIVDGAPVGFRLYSVTPGSLPSRLGLANGDTLQAVNGFSLTSAGNALDAYTQLREATSLELSLQRRGKPLTLKVSIR